MQVTKDYIKKDIQEAARELFLEKGYANVSMREISEKSQVGLSNIYNYFKNKNELFLTIVKPVVDTLYQILETYTRDYSSGIITTEGALYQLISQYLTFYENHKKEINVILFHARGSSLQNFKKDFTQKATAYLKQKLHQIREKDRKPEYEISDFTLNLHAVLIFTLFEETIKKEIKQEELKNRIDEYILFETQGYK